MTEFRTLLSNFVKKSQTNGLLKNDGTVDTTNYLSTHQDITGKEDKSNKVTSISSSSTDTEYPSAKCVYDGIREFINTIYPVGSIYISANEVSPTTLFGGTWVKIQDRFLLGASDTYANESTGGEATHTLTTNEMPSHTHIQNSHNHTQNSHNHTQNSHNHTQNAHNHALTGSKSVGLQEGSKLRVGYGSTSDSKNTNNATATNKATTATNQSATATNNSQTATNQNTGGGQAHNNMPPYFSVDIWKKISNNSPFFIDKGIRDSYDTSNFGDIVQIESSSSALKGHLYNASINIDAYKFNSTGTGTKFFPITALNGKSRIRLVMELYVPSSNVTNTVLCFGVATTQNDAVLCILNKNKNIHTGYFSNGTWDSSTTSIDNIASNDKWHYCEMIVDNDTVTMNVYNNDNVTLIFTDTITLSDSSNSYSTLANRRYGIAIGYADGSIGYARYIEATEL